MTIANRGTKRRCPSCSTAYYDLGRSPIVCPKCQTPYVETQKVPVRAAVRSRAEPVVPADEVAEETAVFDEDETLDSEGLESDVMSEDEQEEEDSEDRE